MKDEKKEIKIGDNETIFAFKVVIKDCDTEFIPGLGNGVVALGFAGIENLTPEKRKTAKFRKDILDISRKVLRDIVEVSVTEIAEADVAMLKAEAEKEMERRRAASEASFVKKKGKESLEDMIPPTETIQ